MSFVHLHVHSQYSILDGFSSMSDLFKRAEELKMEAIALTDHGNMFGVKEFLKVAKKSTVKPIIGCEVYVTRHYDPKLKDNEHKKYYHLILLAKNFEGYKNLSKIVSAGHIEGSYYGKPRVSHEIIEKYHENLICCSACLAGEIPSCIIAGDLKGAKEAVEWHKRVFGEDYYLEVMLHKTEIPGVSLEVYNEQKNVNKQLFEIAEECGVKVLATNDVHFVRKEDGEAHDHLICLNTGRYLDEENRMRYTQQEYLKSEEEMAALFPDHPEVISNTAEVAGKIESYKIDRGHILPKFELPQDFMGRIADYLQEYKEVVDAGRNDENGSFRGEEFCNSVAYLCHLCYIGAEKRYGKTLSNEQAERIDFELKTISKMGFPDYFLIVQDYIAASRAAGSLVGPGRGSAAGSVVAYCLGITNLDPLKYHLLFERFLNPDRISMPDIDVDFEDLAWVHDYVEKKYGDDHVSRVITFGTMAAKSSIKDVARVNRLSLDESNRLSSLVPDRLSEKVQKEYPYNPALDTLKEGFKAIEKEVEIEDPDNPGQLLKVKKYFQKGWEEDNVKINLKNCYRLVPEFKKELVSGSEEVKRVLKFAGQLEGCVRQVGVHACATIIGRGNLTDFIPVCLSKDKETGKDLWTSQYDGHYIEEVGMLKMDFLGLITLSIIHKTLDNIKLRHGLDIDIEAIPIDDAPTYSLYGRGDTSCVFQFESPGMREWLQRLHPERFEDLIAMNALYRPGPMDYIPNFVERKLGNQAIEYDLPDMEEFLSDTYGITVYQEQVMLLSQKLAGFTKGEADQLRKAMGKKLISLLASLKDKFMSGGMKKGHPEKILDKIWKDWEKFAQYAFNKSHATCYAWVSYQTGWLKCHYTAEFLAANLSCNLSNMGEIKKILAECRSHKIKVLSPDVNESEKEFTVNKDGNIRFGFGGIKSFGSNIVDAILKERQEKSLFTDIYDFIERMSGTVNKKAFEALVYSGAFDSFGLSRHQFFTAVDNGNLFLDELLRYGELSRRNADDNEFSLFGEVAELKPVKPEIPELRDDYDDFSLLQKEKDFVGMYLSAHPLDNYKFEIDNFTTCSLSRLSSLISECDKERRAEKVNLAGIVVSSVEKRNAAGKPWGTMTLEDYDGNYEFRLFGADYERYQAYLKDHSALFLECQIEERRMKLSEEDIKNGKKIPYILNIKNISLLGNLCESKVCSLTINIDTQIIDSNLREKLSALIATSKGNTRLVIKLYDRDTKYCVELNSKKYSVSVNTELIQGLGELGLSWQVGTK